MKYKTDILALFNHSQRELNKVITNFKCESNYAHIAQEIRVVLRLLHRADGLIIKHHLAECITELFMKKQIGEGIKQVMLAYKYVQREVL